MRTVSKTHKSKPLLIVAPNTAIGSAYIHTSRKPHLQPFQPVHRSILTCPLRSRPPLNLASLTCVVAALAITGYAQFAVPEIDPLLLPHQPVVVGQLGAGTIASATAARTPKKQERMTISEPGSWGQLEWYPVFLEAPANLIEKFPLPNSRPRWVFPKSMVQDLPALFNSAGLDSVFSAALLSPAAMVIDGDWAYLFPPIAQLEAMTPVQREVIYPVLRKYEQNEFHFEPVIITSDDVDEWFRSSHLRPEILAKVKQMAYRRGTALAFSDLPALMNYTQGEAEARDMLKAFTRTRSYVVRLIVNDKTDLSSVINYWTTGLNLRRKDVEPLLQSIIDTEGVDSIDVVHMLPALPRKLFMTYPDMGLAKDGIYPDCHWTSLNFFNYDAQPYLLDSRLATTAVLERFDSVKEPYKFGDVLFFLDKQGDAFHSCVFIADGFVFSKNGRNVLSPWILTRIDDLKKVYLFDDNGRIQGYRNKNAPKMTLKAAQ